jgi:hypothetical protein
LPAFLNGGHFEIQYYITSQPFTQRSPILIADINIKTAYVITAESWPKTFLEGSRFDFSRWLLRPDELMSSVLLSFNAMTPTSVDATINTLHVLRAEILTKQVDFLTKGNLSGCTYQCSAPKQQRQWQQQLLTWLATSKKEPQMMRNLMLPHGDYSK